MKLPDSSTGALVSVEPLLKLAALAVSNESTAPRFHWKSTLPVVPAIELVSMLTD